MVTDLKSLHLFLESFRDFLKVLLTIFHFAFPLYVWFICEHVCGVHVYTRVGECVWIVFEHMYIPFAIP